MTTSGEELGGGFDAQERRPQPGTTVAAQPSGATPTTCIETIGGDPNTAIRLSFQIRVF